MQNCPNLDLLRSLAVCLVVLSHLRYFIPWQYETIYSIETLGRLGVAIFFVHTTLVLLMSLRRSGEAAGAFLVRRVFRIYPLSICVVVLTALPGLLHGNVDMGKFASNLLLVQNISGHGSSPQPLWSLPYEMQMYLFLPALFAVARGSRPLFSIAALWVASIPLGMQFDLLRFVPCFLPGALAFVLWRPRWPAWVLFAVVAFAIAAIPPAVAAGVPEIPLFWGLCLALGLAIPACLPHRSGRLTRIGKTVATYSYGVYLTHIMALGLAFADGRTGPLEWIAFAVLLPALAWAAYRFVEHPAMEFGKRLVSRPPPRLQMKA
jgi:peptidoglycan/LPS O-acetylase OafA/YrhL